MRFGTQWMQNASEGASEGASLGQLKDCSVVTAKDVGLYRDDM